LWGPDRFIWSDEAAEFPRRFIDLRVSAAPGDPSPTVPIQERIP
jgi:hypothetical protein